jgi:hypothetical protein
MSTDDFKPQLADAAFPAPNSILSGSGFHVSFNDRDLGIYGCVTTALVKGQMESFLILDGDHRKAYAGLVPQGYEACLAYFESLPDRVNKRSDGIAAPSQDEDAEPGPFSP